MDSNEQKLIDAGCSCDLSVGWVCGFHREFTEYKKAAQAHTDALVAAAVEECVRAACDAGENPRNWITPDQRKEIEIRVRSLTPPAIRRALELREVKVQLEEARNLWHQDFVEAYNGGTLTAQGREVLRKRIADLNRRREELEGSKQ